VGNVAFLVRKVRRLSMFENTLPRIVLVTTREGGRRLEKIIFEKFVLIYRGSCKNEEKERHLIC
jgi:hypothetical protein